MRHARGVQTCDFSRCQYPGIDSARLEIDLIQLYIHRYVYGRSAFTRLITKFSTVFLVTRKSWTLKLLAFDEYCRFDTSAFC